MGHPGILPGLPGCPTFILSASPIFSPCQDLRVSGGDNISSVLSYFVGWLSVPTVILWSMLLSLVYWSLMPSLTFRQKFPVHAPLLQQGITDCHCSKRFLIFQQRLDTYAFKAHINTRTLCPFPNVLFSLWFFCLFKQLSCVSNCPLLNSNLPHFKDVKDFHSYSQSEPDVPNTCCLSPIN